MSDSLSLENLSLEDKESVTKDLRQFRYHVVNVEVMGEGSQAKVYSAMRLKSGRRIAIKRIDYRKKLRHDIACHEVDALTKLRGHPHILRIYFACKSGEVRLIVTELCERGDLLEHLNRHGPYYREEEDAALIMRPILSAVSFAHSRGYVHRDIKLENIYVSAEGRIVLGDWGMSTTWSVTKKLSDYIGSTHYSAPEILCQQEYTGPEVDIWSIGVVFYAVMHAWLPFRFGKNHDYAESLESLLTKKPAFSPLCSDTAKSLILSMLNITPYLRPSARELLKHPWFSTGAPRQKTVAVDA
jgi:serine/threonine protein kinase